MTQAPQRHRKVLKSIAYVGYLCLILLLAYCATAAYRGQTLYNYIKAKRTMVTEGLIEVDASLGYAPTADSSGLMMLEFPPDIPFVFDGDRCRIAESDVKSAGRKPVMLFLGGSFTLGAACNFADTYPALVAEHFDGTARNRGFSAYGLSQMVLIARDSVPRMNPDFVFAQYSPWLVSRSMTHFAPALSTKRPQPYFYGDLRGAIQIHDPPYLPYSVQMPADRYRDTRRGLGDMLSFALTVSVPLYFNEDLRFLIFRAHNALGHIPPATRDRRSVLVAAYTELAAICEQNGARLVVPVIGTTKHEPSNKEIALLKEIPGVKVVDCWLPLLKELPDDDGTTYLSHYAHYRGNPPRLVNKHPNAKAHSIIAATIITEIENE